MPASIVYFLNTEKWWKNMKTNVWNVNQQFAKYSICYLIIYSSSQTICCLFIKKCFGLFVVPWEFVKNCWKCRDNFWAVSSESKAWVEVRPRADWIMCYAIIRCISLPSVAARWDVNSGAGPGSQGGEGRGQVMVPVSKCSKLSPSVFLWATAEPYKHDSVFSVRRPYHTIYQVFGVHCRQ